MENRKIVLIAGGVAVLALAAIGLSQHQASVPLSAQPKPGQPQVAALPVSADTLQQARTNARLNLERLERMTEEEWKTQQQRRQANRERWDRLTPEQKADIVRKTEEQRARATNNK